MAILLSFTGTISMQASESYENDPEHKRLYARFLDLYNDPSHPELYYQAVDSLAKYYRKHNLKAQYYKTQLNICLYDAEHNNPAKAMKQARAMLEEMEAERFDAYYQVYTALGTIYENRGNYRMAKHFYEECVNTMNPDDPKFKMAAYSRFANLMMFHEPTLAKQWNDKYYELSLSSPDYYQVNLYISSMINFALSNEHGFRKCMKVYLESQNKNTNFDTYGLEAMKIAELAFNNQYEDALYLLDHKKTSDLNDMATFDMRTIIYKRMNRSDLVIQNLERRSECIDSLNSDMLFNNLNEINTAAGLSSAKNKALAEHQRLLKIITLLSFIIIVLLVLWMMHSRKTRKQLIEKNNQLRTALVEESSNFYPKLDKIYCNTFLSGLLYEHRSKVSSIIELNYTTRVVDRFQIESNEEGLRKIINQLIHNAIRYTKRGFIRLHCEKSDNEKKLIISLSDSGSGITDEQRKFIADSFYNSDVNEPEDTGFATSKKIAQILGGTLKYDENYTEGTRFVLILPLK